MILGSKHVGAILNILMQKNYVCALVGVLIKWLYEMHGATTNDEDTKYQASSYNTFCIYEGNKVAVFFS